MNIVACSVDGCEGISVGRGMCESHYRKWRHRNGSPCSVPKCSLGVKARGLCSRHYQQWRLHDDPLHADTKTKPKCSIEGCYVTEGKVRRGWCPKHYSRWKSHGDPLADSAPCVEPGCGQEAHLNDTLCRDHLEKLRASYGPVCSELSCVEPSRYRGLCRRHYGKQRRDSNVEAVRERQAFRRAASLTDGVVVRGLSWQSLAAQHGPRCWYCGVVTNTTDRSWGSFGPDYPTLDHIIPLSRGGNHSEENVCLACGQCNVSKNNKTPEEWYKIGGPPRLRSTLETL
jgi:5-methylcytosine-specific restriction endonuclease McrA